jgi:hypothetical protein
MQTPIPARLAVQYELGNRMRGGPRSWSVLRQFHTCVADELDAGESDGADFYEKPYA